jgi:uncharacterized tellurite resistance protein B-like protein
MGLFDAFKGNTEVSLNQEEAIAGLMLIAVAADGVAEPEELRVLMGICIRIKALARSNLDSLFNNVGKQIKKFGMEKVAVAACAKLAPDQKKAVFLHFLDILLSDGSIAKEEEVLAVAVQGAMGLDDNFVRGALAMLAEKNRI